MDLPPSEQTVKSLHTSKQPFNCRATLVATQWAAILCFAEMATVVGDHRDAIFHGRSLIQGGVRIVIFVADQPLPQLIEEASGKNNSHKPALGRRSTFHRKGERKTIASGDCDDLCALATPSRADGEPPFVVLAKVASANASSRFSLPRWCRCGVSIRLPSRTHCRKRRWRVWNGGYLEGNSAHCAPLPNIHSTPFITVRVSCQGRSRLCSRRAGRRTGSTNALCSSISSQRPNIAHLRRCLSTSGFAEIRPEPFSEIDTGAFYTIMFNLYAAVKNLHDDADLAIRWDDAPSVSEFYASKLDRVRKL